MKTICELSSLKGRRALVTGAVGGIGRKMVETIAELGGSLILVDKPGSDYQPLIDFIGTSWDVKIISLDCDLEDEKQREELIKTVHGDGVGLDVLINNAGFVGTSDLKGWVTDFERQTIETWQRALEVNLTAVFDLSKGLVPLLKKKNRGSIINVASIYGMLGPDYSLYSGTEMGNPAAYAASKGGVIQLTRWLSTTLAPQVRVNTISPGGVYRQQSDVFVKRYEARTPLGRMAREDDFKGVTAYLASDLSAYVTGQNLVVDGGWTGW